MKPRNRYASLRPPSPPPMGSLSPTQSVRALRKQLADGEAEMKQLLAAEAQREADIAERERVEAETARAKEQLNRLAAQTAAEQQRIAELNSGLDAQSRSQSCPTTRDRLDSLDPVALKHSVEMLRKRNAALRKSVCRGGSPRTAEPKALDPTKLAAMEENAAAMQQQMLMKQQATLDDLKQRRVKRERELRQLDLELKHMMVKAEDKAGINFDQAKSQEEHIKNLLELERKSSETLELRLAAAAELKRDWSRWDELLTRAASLLEARGESFSEQLGASAEAMLELVRKSDARRGAAHKREAAANARVAELQERLSKLHTQIDAQKAKNG